MIINSDFELHMISSLDDSPLVGVDSADGLSDAFFEEAARVLEVDHVPLVNAPTLPHAGKAPTTEAELATAVDGGIRDLCIDGMPGQGLHVILPVKPRFCPSCTLYMYLGAIIPPNQ